MNLEIKHTTMFFAHLKSGKSESYRQQIFDERKTLRDFHNWCKEVQAELEAENNTSYIITNCKIFRDEQ